MIKDLFNAYVKTCQITLFTVLQVEHLLTLGKYQIVIVVFYTEKFGLSLIYAKGKYNRKMRLKSKLTSSKFCEPRPDLLIMFCWTIS